MDLLEQLKQYCARGCLPMHMPGHKRNTERFPALREITADLDITEIDGFDNLHEAVGCLRQAMERAGALWGSKRSFFLINGSTGGILAALRTLAAPGDRVLMARGCHKSVYHGVELFGLRPAYIQPGQISGQSFSAGVSLEMVEQAFGLYPDCRALILTSPTYEGVLSDLARIIPFAHQKEVSVLVDEAHGSHLQLSPYFSGGAVACGADIVIQSLHKTLPSLTQTAIAHICGDRVDCEKMAENLALFQTSSPSYLLMASIDSCIGFIRTHPEAFAQWRKNIERFAAASASLRHLQVYHGEGAAFGFDPSKLVITIADAAATGAELADKLRREHGIEVEMAAGDYVLAMTGLGDKDASLQRFAAALRVIDRQLTAGERSAPQPAVPVPEQACTPGEAAAAEKEQRPLAACGGAVSGEYLWAYPPGIPLLVPGERVGQALVDALKQLAEQGVAIHSTTGAYPDRLRVLKK